MSDGARFDRSTVYDEELNRLRLEYLGEVVLLCEGGIDKAGGCSTIDESEGGDRDG